MDWARIVCVDVHDLIKPWRPIESGSLHSNNGSEWCGLGWGRVLRLTVYFVIQVIERHS